MVTVLTILTIIAFIGVVGTLVMGAMSMKGSGIKDRESSNLWMRRRITAQVLAIGLLFLTVYVKKDSGA